MAEIPALTYLIHKKVQPNFQNVGIQGVNLKKGTHLKNPYHCVSDILHSHVFKKWFGSPHPFLNS